MGERSCLRETLSDGGSAVSGNAAFHWRGRATSERLRARVPFQLQQVHGRDPRFLRTQVSSEQQRHYQGSGIRAYASEIHNSLSHETVNGSFAPFHGPPRNCSEKRCASRMINRSRTGCWARWLSSLPSFQRTTRAISSPIISRQSAAARPGGERPATFWISTRTLPAALVR